MNRRTFLKLTGLVSAGRVLQSAPIVSRPEAWLAPAEPGLQPGATPALPGPSLIIAQPGTYQVSGLVRLEAPLVEISGIANRQWISWSDSGRSEAPLARFVTYEQYDRAGMTPDIRVRGGQLQSLTAVPLD